MAPRDADPVNSGGTRLPAASTEGAPMATAAPPENTGRTWLPEAEIDGPPMEAEAVPVNSGGTWDADAETLGAPMPRDEVPRASTGIPEIGVSESARKPSIVRCYPLLREFICARGVSSEN